MAQEQIFFRNIKKDFPLSKCNNDGCKEVSDYLKTTRQVKSQASSRMEASMKQSLIMAELDIKDEYNNSIRVIQEEFLGDSDELRTNLKTGQTVFKMK